MESWDTWHRRDERPWETKTSQGGRIWKHLRLPPVVQRCLPRMLFGHLLKCGVSGTAPSPLKHIYYGSDQDHAFFVGVASDPDEHSLLRISMAFQSVDNNLWVLKRIIIVRFCCFTLLGFGEKEEEAE